MKKFYQQFLFILLFLNSSFAQIPGNQRGLYINKFIVLNNNDDINTNFSILGNSVSEDNLLDYCDQNHITYITLFDVRKIFIGTTGQVTAKKTALSAFICKAKGDHCIEFVGASVGGFGTTDDIITFDETQTPAFVFQMQERNMLNYSLLSFVEQDISITDERFHNAECTKDALRLMFLHHPVYGIGSVPCTNGAPNNNIDIITTEWEFWNADFPYFIPNSDNDYQDLINSINSARDQHNHDFPSEPVYVETYLGFLSAQSNPGLTACEIASWIDGTYTGMWANYRRVDRILAHYYNLNPSTAYNSFNTSGYYTNRFKNFCEANNDAGESCDGQGTNGPSVVSNDNTDYHPIFSSESVRLGSSPSDNFLGDYLAGSTSRNIFTVEREWYDDFKADGNDTRIHTAPDANNVEPGAAQWFTQSYMQNPLRNPITFLSNTPICATTGNQTVTFVYQGPIEQGITWTFTLTDWQSNSIAPSSGSTTGTTQDYNTNPLPSLPNYNLPINPNPSHPYTASLTLNYGGCSYVYTEKIYVTDHIQIYALNHPSDYLGPITICEGERVNLRVNQIAGSNYQWKINGVDILGATGFEYITTITGDFTCTVANASCSGTSNIVQVNVTSNPFRYIVIGCGGDSCSNGNEVTLTVYPNNTQLGGGDTYLWNTTSSTTNQSITICVANTYHVRITRNGCVRYQSQQVSNASLGSGSNPAAPTITASPSNTVCLGSPVTLSSTPSPYVWSTGDLGNTLITYNAGIYFSIVRSSATRCQAVSNIITVSTNLAVPTLLISSPVNSICEGDPITFTATPSNAGTVPQFEWSSDNGSTWSTLTTSNTFSPVLAPGNYVLKARVLSNAACASPLHIESSNAISFTVNAVPSVPLLPTSNSPQCSDVGVSILHGIPPVEITWYWQNSASGTSTSNSTSPYTVFISGTYFLRAKNNTASCWSGATNINVVVNQSPTVTVTVNQNQSCPSLNDGSATANPTPSVGSNEYHWSQKPLILTQSITGLPALTQTVYVTNTTTQCSSNPTPFTINPATPVCNNATYHVCASPTNVSSYYGSGFSGGTSGTHVRVAIHNDFIIDNNFTIQYADIAIDPGVRIIVNQNKTLNIASSNLTKCTTLWQGIVLNTGSVLNVTNNSEVDDAIIAVDAPGGSTVNLWNSSFLRNDVSAYIHNGDFTNKVNIYGNHFDFQNMDLKDPTATYHINIQQANNVLIGNIAQGKNYFTHASIAINVFTSNATIKNNEFYTLGQTIFTDALSYATLGVAIKCSGTGAPYYLTNIGGTPGTNDKNIFHNIECGGISISDNVDVNIKGNDFIEINRAIQLGNMPSRQIDISENSFLNFASGIYGFELTNSHLQIYWNRFNMTSTDANPTLSVPALYSSLTRYAGEGITIQGVANGQLYYNCHHNWIANCTFGIHSRNLIATALPDVITQHNQIFYTHPESEGGYGYEKGIWLENCDKNQISNNHIRSTTGTPSTIYESGLTGIRFDLSPNNQIKENFIKRMGYGMYGSYGCSNTELHCNSIEDYCNGINGYHLNLSEQGDAGSHVSWKNQWNGIRTGSYRISGSFLQNVRWDYLTPGPENVPSPAVSEISPSGNSTIDPSCTVPTIISGIVKRDIFYEDVAFESAVYNSDPLFNEYDAELLFYSGLNSDTSLLHLGTPDDIVYQEKYSELKNSNIGKFELVNTLIKSGDLQTALTTVNSITDENIMEQYKKKTLQIYLDCRINLHKPTISQKAILDPIANQLGVYGGTATYFARALLNIFVDENHSTSSRMRAPVFYTNDKNKEEKEMHSKLNYIYPNPANNELNFLLPGNISSDKHIRISDCYGGSIERIKWEGSTSELTINTQNYNAGVYFVTLLINNIEIQTNRIVIIH